MERREFLRAMAVLAATPKWLLTQQSSNAAPVLPAPVPWTLGLNPRTPLPDTITADSAGETIPSFFSAAAMPSSSSRGAAHSVMTCEHLPHHAVGA